MQMQRLEVFNLMVADKNRLDSCRFLDVVTLSHSSIVIIFAFTGTLRAYNRHCIPKSVEAMT